MSKFLTLPRAKKRKIIKRYWQMLYSRICRGKLGKKYDWRSEQREIHKFNRRICNDNQ